LPATRNSCRWIPPVARSGGGISRWRYGRRWWRRWISRRRQLRLRWRGYRGGMELSRRLWLSGLWRLPVGTLVWWRGLVRLRCRPVGLAMVQLALSYNRPYYDPYYYPYGYYNSALNYRMATIRLTSRDQDPRLFRWYHCDDPWGYPDVRIKSRMATVAARRGG
jgi:hypothetical protein